VDTRGHESLPFRAVWTAVDGCGHRLEIYGSEGWGFESLRAYSSEDLDLLRFVARLRALEFPLSDVREIVALRRDGKAPCDAVRSTISREAAAIEARIEVLRRLQGELTSLEEEAKVRPDNWPTVCVCDVLESSSNLPD
jgi:hypothetical protein